MTRTAVARAAAHQRRRTIQMPQRVQLRLASASWRIRGQSTRGPMPARIAGSSVSETMTLTSGMSMPPKPIERRNGTGSAMSAARPIATVTPLNTTALPAVRMEATTADELSRP